MAKRGSQEWKENLRKAHLGQVSTWKGKKFSEEHKKKISDAHKGKIGYWAGKKRPYVEEARKKQGLTSKGKLSWQWKGDHVSYSGLHHWIKRELGKPTKCVNFNCVYPRKNASRSWIRVPKAFQWANVSKKYLRETSDFISLCASCHAKWDRGLISIKYE